MPHVTIKLARGRSDEQKARLAEAVAKAVMEGASVPEAAVSVAIERGGRENSDRSISGFSA